MEKNSYEDIVYESVDDRSISLGRLDWHSFPTFLRFFSYADAQVRKRQYSFASTQAIQRCWV